MDDYLDLPFRTVLRSQAGSDYTCLQRLGLGGTKEIVRVTEAEVIYVAVGDDGKPIPINS